MTTPKQLLVGAAIAALVSGTGLTATTSLAQTTDTQGMSQTDDEAAPQTGDEPAPQTGDQDAMQADDDQPQSGGQGAAQADQETAPAGDGGADGGRLIATVNDAEIRETDVTQALESLPPQAQQMPPQMLLPMVVEQLMLRELILARAEEENLREDPEVIALVDPQNEALAEQAMLSVWLQRALAKRVTEERITAAFERFQQANPDSTVTLEAARPQIQQGLTQEAMQQVAEELREGATIVFYDASGDPVPEGGADAGGTDSDSGQSTGTGTGAAGSGQSTDTGTSGTGAAGSGQSTDTGSSGTGAAGAGQSTDTGSGSGDGSPDQPADTGTDDAAEPQD